MTMRGQRIDFQRSNIRWVTRAEKSIGSFQIEAVVRLWPGATTSPKQFVLGAAVLAGNMYVDDELCKNPPYMFQVAGGEDEFAIFRTDLSSSWSNALKKLRGRSKALDSFGRYSQTFDSFGIHLDVEKAKSVCTYEEIAEHFSRRDIFTCLITIDFSMAGKIELEFPVKHLNLLPSRQMWQLETGPILFPWQVDFVPLPGNTVADFLPYFAHANRFDCADFSPDFPFPQGMSLRASSAKRGKIPCHVQLLVNDE
jgi:hypothetical protein